MFGPGIFTFEFQRQGGHNGQATFARRALGKNRTFATSRSTKTQRWTTSYFQSRGINGDSVRSQDWHSMGVFAEGDELRQRNDLLASAPGLAQGGSLEEDLAKTFGRARRKWHNRLEHICNRQLQCSRSFWGAKTGPNPTDRGKNGSKRHLITDGQGIPLVVEHTAANVHDSEMAIPLVDSLPSIKTEKGGRRKRPDELLADRAYDAEDKIRRPLRHRKIKPLIAKRYTEHGSGLGKYRYVVETCFDWLFNWRRLRCRYEKRDDIHDAFLAIGCFMICWNRVNQFC